ncbi:MAG: hypothetical protein GY895_01770 [Phycisphaera sp.]|nr:hypothetical protein [Phycisphaera sp.]
MNDWNEHENGREHEGADGQGDPTEERPEGASVQGEQLPFGMSGVSGILERLADGVESDEWSPRKCRMVAEYVLSLSGDYWLSSVESTYCRRLLA